MYVLLSVILLSFFYNLYANVKLQVKFPENQNCVAYKTNKSMIFQDSVDVIGLNCSITVSKKNDNGKIIIVTEIPADKFDTGEKERDKYVFRYLKGKTRPSLLFTSESYSQNQFKNIINGSINLLKGNLLIGNNNYPVELKLTKINNYLTGKIETNFTHFNLKPPSVGPFGMVAEVKDYLELQFQVKIPSI